MNHPHIIQYKHNSVICECATYYLKVTQETGEELYFIKRLLYLTWKIGLFKLGLTCGIMRLDGLRV